MPGQHSEGSHCTNFKGIFYSLLYTKPSICGHLILGSRVKIKRSENVCLGIKSLCLTHGDPDNWKHLSSALLIQVFSAPHSNNFSSTIRSMLYFYDCCPSSKKAAEFLLNILYNQRLILCHLLKWSSTGKQTLLQI